MRWPWQKRAEQTDAMGLPVAGSEPSMGASESVGQGASLISRASIGETVLVDGVPMSVVAICAFTRCSELVLQSDDGGEYWLAGLGDGLLLFEPYTGPEQDLDAERLEVEGSMFSGGSGEVDEVVRTGRDPWSGGSGWWMALSDWYADLDADAPAEGQALQLRQGDFEGGPREVQIGRYMSAAKVRFS